jgi:antitoxin ParD1/3/4
MDFLSPGKLGLNRPAEKVPSSLVYSASEVMREALRLFFQFDESRSREIDLFNRRIAEGLAQLDRGEAISGDEARRLTKDRIAARRNAKRTG